MAKATLAGIDEGATAIEAPDIAQWVAELLRSPA
jgi:hypothetical protein